MSVDIYVAFWQNFKGRVPGFSVKTVDTTGAGDAFVGALLVSVAKDASIFDVLFFFPYSIYLFMPFPCVSVNWYLALALQNEGKLRETLTFANACGAICTTQKGAIPALPSNSDALALIKSKAN